MKLLFTALIAALAVTSSVAIDNVNVGAAAETNVNAIPEANLNTNAGSENNFDAVNADSSGRNGLRGRRNLWYGYDISGSQSQSSGFATGQLSGFVAGNQGFLAGSQNSFSSAPGTFSNNGNRFNAAFNGGPNGFGQLSGNFQSGAQSSSSRFNQNFRRYNGWW